MSSLIFVLLLQALLVFILYVRCTAINPADPGIMSKFDSRVTNILDTNHGLSVKDLPKTFDGIITGHSSPSSASRSSIAGGNSTKKGSVGELGGFDIPAETIRGKSSCSFGGIFCALFVHEDCRKQDEAAEQQFNGDALFCTLCNAEVLHYDKYNLFNSSSLMSITLSHFRLYLFHSPKLVIISCIIKNLRFFGIWSINFNTVS